MREIKVAVVGDLHCHSSESKPADSFLLCDALRAPTNSHPVESLLDRINRDNISADILLVAGDLTNKISQQGMISAWGFVKEIGQSLSVDLIAATLGNHDVDSRQGHSSDPFKIPRAFSPQDFPHVDPVMRNSFWQEGFFIADSGELRILVVNSVIHHRTEQEAKRGEINEFQLERLSAALESSPSREFQLALVHHHPIAHENLGLGSEDLMVNGGQLVELLEAHSYHMIIHGHKHFPRLRYAPGGSSSPVVFAAGSLCAFSPQMLSNTRNLFHVISLGREAIPGCVRQGKILSWEYNSGKGWSRPARRSADFPHVAGFGCRSSVADIAQSIALQCDVQPGSYRPWSEVASSLPQVEFLLPADAEMLEATLKDGFGLIVHPGLLDGPQIIGRA